MKSNKKKRKKSASHKSRVNIINCLFILVLCIIIIVIVHLIRVDHIINNDQIKSLYSILGNENTALCNGLISYNYSYIDQTSRESTELLCQTYTMLDSSLVEKISVPLANKEDYCLFENEKFYPGVQQKVCNIEKIYAPNISALYNRIYGIPLLHYINFKISNNKTCFYNENYFYCGIDKKTDNNNIIIDISSTSYREIYNVVEKGETVFIYDYFIKINNNKCYKDYNENYENVDCSNNLSKYTVKELLRKYGTIYKHEFENNSWISSEPIN